MATPLTVSSEETNPLPSTVALVGNPNVGKSVLFKNLTDRYVIVSNFSGTTVEVVRAKARDVEGEVEIVDTPGINDLTSRSEDARVTRRILDSAEDLSVVQVADAKNLRRALLLTLQLAELGHPMALVLNMLDELRQRGGRIKTRLLSEILGIPVVSTIAVRNEGTDAVLRTLPKLAVPTIKLDNLENEPDDYSRNRRRLERVNEILSQVYSISQPSSAPMGVRLGFWAMHPVKGLALVAVVLLAVFWIVGLFGAGTLVDLMETGLFEQRVQPLAIRATDALLSFPHVHDVDAVTLDVELPWSPTQGFHVFSYTRDVISTNYSLVEGAELDRTDGVQRFLHDFLVGEYGMLTMALSYALAIVLPIVTTFFILFSLMEDSGYLPRMSIMVNKIFKIMGLNGKAVLPMILGLGCDTMATMTTRILETRKERIVTTLLLALAVPCSAQLGVLLAMMAHISFAAAVVWLVMMSGIMIFVGWLTSRIFGGATSDFILEIPPMRKPQLANIWVKTTSRVEWYLREVLPLFVVGTAALFLLDRFGALKVLTRWGRPLVEGWLGLPPETANAFLVGFMRRDFGAVYLLDAIHQPIPLLSPLQVFVAMVTITLFMPCIANFLMIAKEHGQKVAWSMAAFIFPFAFLMGGFARVVGSWLFAS